MFASCLKCHALCWVGLLSLLTAAECQAQLAAPFAVHVNNQPLDVERFEKKLSPAEEQTKRETGQQLEHAFVRWSRVYRSYRLLKAGQAGTGQAPLPQQPGTEEPAALTAARKQLQRLTTEQELLYLAQDALQAGQQIHGRVWVFLRE